MKIKVSKRLETHMLPNQICDDDYQHFIREPNGRCLLYNRSLSLVKILDVSIMKTEKSWETNYPYHIDLSNNWICVYGETGLQIYDFEGRELFALQEDILAISTARDCFVWLAINVDREQVECRLIHISTKKRASVYLNDPMTGMVPDGEHAVEFLGIPERSGEICLCFTDAQCSIKTYCILESNGQLEISEELEDDFYPLCFSDDGLQVLTRTFADFDGVFRTYSIPEWKVVGEVNFPDEESMFSMTGFYLNEHTVLVYEENMEEYCCLNADSMRLEKLEIDWNGYNEGINDEILNDYQVFKSGNALFIRVKHPNEEGWYYWVAKSA
ncbi:hypothetical protein [Paenibacillus sp. GCM10027626]|uniref:hypothetical protein n=1 Tax=Paenibacillus sp. GCM10027626 TaxID=3273411 RepID=UPI0036328852